MIREFPHIYRDVAMEGSLADLTRQAITSAMRDSDRSRYSKDKMIGVSDIGTCREYARRMILNEPWSDEQDDYMAAFIGTAVGDHLEKAALANGSVSSAQGTVVVDLDVRGYRISIPGHSDIVGDNFVADFKGLDIDTPIPTPSGWTTMGGLSVGDTVFDAYGLPVKVIHASEVKSLRCYEVTFANGHKIVCDEEHYWYVQRSFRGAPEVVQIGDLTTSDRAPVAMSLVTDPTELPVDPWMLGYWIGNGHRRQAMVSCHADDAEQVSDIAKRLGYTGLLRRDKRGSNAATVSLGSSVDRKRSAGGEFLSDGGRFIDDLRRLGIHEVKAIPSDYLRAAIPQRVRLLQGLMDSDGTWNTARRRAVFTTTVKDIADGVAELARSLGQRVQTHSHSASGYGKVTEAHIVEWTPTFNPFRLWRKAQKVVLASEKSRAHQHKVISIKEVPSRPTRCIGVDSPTSTYLAGEAMIPTHNTKSGLGVVRREGPSRQQVFQITLYAKALIDGGVLNDDCTVALIFIDRSGDDPDPVVFAWQYDTTIVDEIIQWLDDVIYAVENGEEASKDQPRDWCFKACPYATSCRGFDTDVTGLVEDPTVLDAIEVYREANATIRAAEKDKKSAMSVLTGVAGSTGKDIVRWITIPGGYVGYDRAEYQRIDIRPIKKGSK